MTATLSFLFLICVLVTVHEYGHFAVARACGVRVLRFSIGFGKVLWKRTDKKGTEWVISLIPLGGYVKMLNDEQGFADSERYDNKAVWQRMLIILAGPVANFIFAIFAYWAVFVSGVPTLKPVVGEVVPNSIVAMAKIPTEFEFTQIDGRNVQDWEEVALAFIGNVGSEKVEVKGHLIDSQYPQSFQLDLSQWQFNGNKDNPLTALGIIPKRAIVEPIIKTVVKDSVAEKVGLQAKDIIRKVNQAPFDWHHLIEVVQTGKQLQLEIKRDTEILTFNLLPQQSKESKRYVIGITPQYQPLAEKYRVVLEYGILEAFEKGVEKVTSLIHTVFQFIVNLITGNLSIKNMGGPIAMAKGAVASAEVGFIYYLSFMALISVNLGVMNLFPLLPLDGGQFILLSVEAIRGKATSKNLQERFQQLGMIFVIGLMVFALFNDLIHF
ncbi:RIP metalloprotease RseP [Pasteurella atlantica]|uniref:RIP metalloprotease RseP n=2 Tax=Pasteurellaceae TaxID=712 RepID=A0ACC6HNU8_9PAST|nr:RIP metalloprotease RseP [Pasteurella atlantica]MDP8034337.1 RIP metalloprotease RseP [Pasteurella atlantica]MDP8036277.1 RIP metalloprotease RseP [Pasteurella atlantica]MDP8038220.1 RIP metalloprotease RseP [Pasteurella atlantica]MDP8048582.1 RIP metalloprotease RseP [Pasteurella atlantica]MDP8050531.1 RIP metalloprotease RseP [Pasteurella atlantica]